MKHRIDRIYTRTGDTGTTGTASGERVRKDCLIVEAIGDVDELNCIIGMLLSYPISEEIRDDLHQVQHNLFNIGGELSSSDKCLIKSEQVDWIENKIDLYNDSLPPLKEFILPSGSIEVATCHLARAICRRAERHIVAYYSNNNEHNDLLAYINRLSDLLFVYCRKIAAADLVEEKYWNPAI